MDNIVHENTARIYQEGAFVSGSSEGTRSIQGSVVGFNQERLARKNLEPGMRTDVCVNSISSIKTSEEQQHGAEVRPDKLSQESIVRSSQDLLIKTSPECSVRTGNSTEAQKPSEQTIVPSNQESWLPASLFWNRILIDYIPDSDSFHEKFLFISLLIIKFQILKLSKKKHLTPNIKNGGSLPSY